MQVNVAEAKRDISKIIQLIKSGQETQIDIAWYGEPVASVVPFRKPDTKKRIGIAKGVITIPGNLDRYDIVIEQEFEDYL